MTGLAGPRGHGEAGRRGGRQLWMGRNVVKRRVRPRGLPVATSVPLDGTFRRQVLTYIFGRFNTGGVASGIVRITGGATPRFVVATCIFLLGPQSLMP